MKELRDDRVHARMALVRDLFGLEGDEAGFDAVQAPGDEELAEVRELRRR